MKCIPIPRLTVKQLADFWSKVDKKSDDFCWLWKSYFGKDGYGRFQIGDKQFRASRVMLSVIGKRNNKLEVCHSCNNTLCVNPSHLRFGTNRDNYNDKVLAERDTKGSRHGESKLSEMDIPIIRALSAIFEYKSIGRIFGVSASMICRIVRGRNWTHVKGIATDKETANFLDKLNSQGIIVI